MIVSCPDCSARLRLDPARLAGKRLTLRCARCRKIFKVEVPAVAAPREDRPEALRVLIAHSDRDLCQAVLEILSREGLEGRVCSDGHQALEALQTAPAQVAVIDVALPGLLAFELIDQARRVPSLKDLRIILLSSVYNKTAYKRTPNSLYGADDYIEKHHIPDDLVPKIHRLVGAAQATAPAGSPGSEVTVGEGLADGDEEQAFQQSMSDKIRQAEERETADAALDQSREKARRLARIIVADIALYNQERVDEGVRSGRFFELLASEIAEGKRLFLERFDGSGSGDEVLEEAFAAFIQRRRAELGIQP